jgi:uncharacterized protein YdhG (YjbR/CyaY superfamily)
MTATKTNARKSKGLSAEERAALKERLKEEKAEREGKMKEADVLAKIAEMPEPDRTMATRIHEIVKANAPQLTPRTWYGMPAYANKEGKVACFFTAASKFNERYASFGFNAAANLDEGNMWPTAFALLKITPAEEAQIAALVKKAVREQ